MVQPIWQALTDLGIEGEYCKSAVDAVERVTTQLFQIVITDWEDQPEAAFLLKTARDLKAAHRPLTLAIVSDDSRLPEALQAGANSILLKPIRAEQVRDTLRTACELLRAKVQPSSKPIAPAVVLPEKPKNAGMAAAAGAVSRPNFVTQPPENTFRAGEFLQSPSSTPGAQFDTESEVQQALEEVPLDQVNALTDLEPTAAAVQDAAREPVKPQEAMTGWAALQARLAKSPAPLPAKEGAPSGELMAYGEMPSYGGGAVSAAESRGLPSVESHEESRSEAALFNYMAGKAEEPDRAREGRPSKHGTIFILGGLAVVCLAMTATARGRHLLQTAIHTTAQGVGKLLNPPPARIPQAAVQHDSFGQSGDEYKLPAAGNMPDAATDASQIRVLPVVDPTAKAEKTAEANTVPTAAISENAPAEQKQGAPSPSLLAPVEGQTQDQAPAGSDSRDKTTAASPVSNIPPEANAGATQAAAASRVPAGPVRSYLPPAPSAVSVGIPSSLKSQVASMIPESSGAKPVEAAMSSIEPVNLPESAARELLAQPVDPVYPASAKGSGQRGSVVLQILIGRDGAVQDAKFMQGSLVFARAAIDALKQWRFKPYLMNGRAVAVQSVITLNFKPPA